VGRAGLEALYGIQPKLSAIARAVVKGDDDLIKLQQKYSHLEEENSRLKRWIELRIAVDEALPRYDVQWLKAQARDAQLTVGGTKSQLLMRLVEAGVLQLD